MSVRELRIWLAGILLGEDLFDGLDSKPLGSAVSSQYDADSYRHFREGRKHSQDGRYSIRTQKTPLPEISRSDEGKFILDKDSDEGGFTSPRRPARGLTGRANWVHQWTAPPESGWTTAVSGIESGVYHVRQGTTRIHPREQPPPAIPARQSVRSNGSGTSTYEIPARRVRSPVIYENTIITKHPFMTPPSYYVAPPQSPQFGQHFIPTSPSGGPILSPKGRLRSSSPGPLTSRWDQLAHLESFHEMSSVKQPSSVERSFPSTILSSFPASNQHTPSFHAMSMEAAQSPYFQYPTSQRRVPREISALTPLYRYPSSRRIHVVGAQIHDPPPQFRTQATTYHPYYLPPPRYYSPWAAYPQPVYRRQYSWMSPQQAGLMRGHAYLGSGQHIHHVPPSRDVTGTFDHSFMSDNSRPYVNIPSLRQQSQFYHQQALRRDPYYLLKPASSSENQKPLATSSPPHLRQNKGDAQLETIGDSSNLRQRLYSNKNVHPLKGAATNGVRKDLNESNERRRTRHHSAPDLSTSEQDRPILISKLKSSSGRPKKVGELKTRSHEVSFDLSHEFSQDQSPDSSSGFGSKNTSHQQSSSQSGQSISALGLDTSRISDGGGSTKASYKPPPPPRPEPLWEVHRITTDPHMWYPARLPPSYEQWLARQMQPQFRVPSISYDYSSSSVRTDYLVPHSAKSDQSIHGAMPKTFSRSDDGSVVNRTLSVDEVDNEVFLDKSSVVLDNSAATSNATANIAKLDISVDNHYEFDTMISPTPIDETLMPASLEWSSSGGNGGNNSLRRLSDSELYGSSTSGDRRRMSQESMEERVAAMKQEFLEYRRRQARRRKQSSSSQEHLESVC